jgi:hypothetical protein
MNDNSKDGRSAPVERRLATRVVAAERDPASYHGFVNPGVYHPPYIAAADVVALRSRSTK